MEKLHFWRLCVCAAQLKNITTASHFSARVSGMKMGVFKYMDSL